MKANIGTKVIFGVHLESVAAVGYAIDEVPVLLVVFPNGKEYRLDYSDAVPSFYQINRDFGCSVIHKTVPQPAGDGLFLGIEIPGYEGLHQSNMESSFICPTDLDELGKLYHKTCEVFRELGINEIDPFLIGISYTP